MMADPIRMFAFLSLLLVFNSVLQSERAVPGRRVHESVGSLHSTLEQTGSDARQCSSKEIAVSFPYDRCVASDTVQSLSPDSHATCGLCQQNPWNVAVQDLSTRLRELVGDRCSHTVTYGAALGGVYEEMLKVQDKCSFMFLLEPKKTKNKNKATNPSASVVPRMQIEEDGEGYIIRIPVSVLPYKNNRRNTKLLKMFGGLKIFSFADRIIWQDAKLYVKIKQRDYTHFYEQNIDNTGACASFRGMPNSRFTVGKKSSKHTGPMFRDHCHVLLNTRRRATPVTDSRESIKFQCKHYEKLQNSTTDTQIPLDHGLIDSALILWDMRSERCRQFNLELACTWLDETQCYGDRDQISFPQALRYLHLTEPYPVVPIESVARDRLFQSDSGLPVVHISRSACHWYNTENDLLKCKPNVYRQYDVESKRVAIVVAGGLPRYNLNSSLSHLIEPMARQGHKVDYYLSLTNTVQKAYRGSMGYMGHLVLDPILPDTDNRTITSSFIASKVAESGGTARRVYFDRPLDVDSHPMLIDRRETAQKKRPGEDPDARFPMFDIRSSAIRERTVRGNKNMYVLFYNIRSLWHDLLDVESEEGFMYDYVMFLRDDTMWLADFDFNELVSTTEPSTELFSLSCDARNPRMHPLEMNDHIAIVTRKRAELFGNYFEHLFDDDVTDCASQLDRSFTWGERRGCNSEMILKWMLTNKGVKIASVGQAVIPFQRSMYVETAPGVVQPCFHKFCQSVDMPLYDHGVKRCSDLFESEQER